MRRRLGLALWLASGSAAYATVAPPLSLEQQAKKAQVIVQAKITAVTPQEQGGQRWTVYRLNVSETLLGAASALPTFENTPALWVLDGVQDAPSFKANDEVILLLYTGLHDSPIVGFNQGAYRIRNGQVEGGQPAALAAFKNALVKARSGQ